MRLEIIIGKDSDTPFCNFEVKGGAGSEEVVWALVGMDEVRKKIFKEHPEIKDYRDFVEYDTCVYDVNKKRDDC